jgi:phosphoribosylformylglycinamidine synthase
VHEQYDTMVQTNTVQGPGGEAGVMRIKGTGARGHERGLAMALDGNGRWCYLDPKLGAMHAVAEAARKVACTGATPVAAMNCLNFGNPEKPEIMAQLSAAIDGIAEACTALGTPITGGNVSLYNETRGVGIYPTPVLGVVGILEDVTKAVPASFQQAGDYVFLIRPNFDREIAWQKELGSSEFAKSVFGALWGVPPSLDVKNEEAALHRLLIKLAEEGILNSACDVSEGGLAVAFAEAGFRNGIGVTAATHQPDWENALHAYFSEDASNVMVTVSAEHSRRLLEIVEKEFGFLAAPLGKTTNGEFRLVWESQPFIESTISDLHQPWAGALESALHYEVTA